MKQVLPVDVEALKTAAQINLPQTGQVTISPIDPDDLSKSLGNQRAAVALGREQDQVLSIKASRASMIDRVRNAREIPLVWQEVLLAEIAAIDTKHDLLRLDFVRHAHGVGANFTGTVKEI